MTPRIQRLRTELERLEETAETCHPDVHEELQALIEDVRAHLNELESAVDGVEEERL
ncbi:MAG: hypothetical protein AB7E79_12915 [Rhodospirillaceae bacterium]